MTKVLIDQAGFDGAPIDRDEFYQVVHSIELKEY
jgi:hypothetical protein